MLRYRRLNIPLYVTAFCLVLITVSCSSGPSAAPQGSPPFYWQAARETFPTGDFVKAASHLEALCKKDSEFTARAQPWRLVLTAGLARGYHELANNFEYGARANKANPTPFRNQVMENRNMAGKYALQFAETFLAFEKRDPAQPVMLDFPYPHGNPAKPIELTKVANGIMIPEAQVLSVQKRMLERGVLLAVFEAVGAQEDAAKTQALFKAGAVQVPNDVFATAVAKNFYEISWIFSREKLDLPERVELLCKEGLDAAKSIKTPTKESKKITSDLEKMLKSVKK